MDPPNDYQQPLMGESLSQGSRLNLLARQGSNTFRGGANNQAHVGHFSTLKPDVACDLARQSVGWQHSLFSLCSVEGTVITSSVACVSEGELKECFQKLPLHATRWVNCTHELVEGGGEDGPGEGDGGVGVSSGLTAILRVLGLREADVRSVLAEICSSSVDPSDLLKTTMMELDPAADRPSNVRMRVTFPLLDWERSAAGEEAGDSDSGDEGGKGSGGPLKYSLAPRFRNRPKQLV